MWKRSEIKVFSFNRLTKVAGLAGLLFAAQASTVLADGAFTPPLDDTLATTALSPAPPIAPPLAQKHVIVLDPGHGGIDPGAVSRAGTREKDVVLAYAEALKLQLESSGRYEVLLTRASDKFVKLDDRVGFARDHKAELLIALHADMLADRAVRGTTVYTVSDQASDLEADMLAKKENGADRIAGIKLTRQKPDVANALFNLAARESKSEALNFAQKTVREIKPVTELTGKPLRSAAFVVLKAPDVPSVLMELGYLSNAADEERLASLQWRRQMADSMVRALDSYFNSTTAQQ